MNGIQARYFWARARPYRTPLILLLLTVGSTFLVGGLWYCLSLMTILLAHELGHFLMSRRYGVRVTLPYFLPLPLPPFGTLGAVIRMRALMPNRRALLDIGAAGPLAGLVFALPAAVFGLKLSSVVDLSTMEAETLPLGGSLLFSFLSKLVVGHIPDGHDVLLHPLAYAGWVGLFVTALNLLPIGQLDGGHVIYALLGGRSKWVFRGALMAFALVCAFFYPGWLVFILFILLFGFRHPPPLDNETPVDLKRKLLGGLTLMLFVASFTPVPFLIWQR